MKILLDNIVYKLQKNGGVSRVWDSIIEHSIIDVKHNYLYLGESKRANINHIKNRKLPLFIRRYLNININNVDLFHSSYFRMHSSKKVINVLTIHDCICEKFDKGIFKHIHLIQKKSAIRKASAIICVSKNTKKDVLEYYPFINPEKIKVIYNGVNNDFHRLENETSASKVLLYIGGRNIHKNFPYVLKLLSSEYCMNNNFSLIIIGGGSLTHNEVKLIKTYGIYDKVKQLNHQTNKQLNKIYNSAFALIYPSFYEGFGIPPLEAMSAGCPVICSNTSSLPEIMEESVLYIDPDDISLGLKHIKILENKKTREKIIKKGFIQAKRFTWEKTGLATLKLYDNLLKLKC